MSVYESTEFRVFMDGNTVIGRIDPDATTAVTFAQSVESAQVVVNPDALYDEYSSEIAAFCKDDTSLEDIMRDKKMSETERVAAMGWMVYRLGSRGYNESQIEQSEAEYERTTLCALAFAAVPSSVDVETVLL